MTRNAYLIVFFTLTWSLTNCSDNSSNTDAGIDGNPGTDTDTDMDTDTDSDSDTDTDTDSDTGFFCDPADLIGSVTINRSSPDDEFSWLTAWVLDKPLNQWIEEPTLSSEECAYYQYDPDLCDECLAPQVCRYDGVCVDPPVADLATALRVTADGEDYTFVCDGDGNILGQLEGTFFSFDLSWSGGRITTDELEFPAGDLVASVISNGDYDSPGTLTASWVDVDFGHVQTTIPINHHALLPTFTRCEVDASASGFQVPAEMVNPLAVYTGLEFQGLVYGEFMSVETVDGCVQFQLITHYYVTVQFP